MPVNCGMRPFGVRLRVERLDRRLVLARPLLVKKLDVVLLDVAAVEQHVRAEVRVAAVHQMRPLNTFFTRLGMLPE